MKQGENEAKIILEKIGIIINQAYCDDNSKKSMPDLKTKDGRYIEVTHTKHNYSIPKTLNDFAKKNTDEKRQISDEAHEAYCRISKGDYQRDFFFKLTDSSKKQHEKDTKLVKNHFGIDESGKCSEFGCDLPIVECSLDNILETIYIKAKKYPDRNTDLFLFMLNDEYELIIKLKRECKWNGLFSTFMNAIYQTPFQNIYLCQWDFKKQSYQLEDSVVLKFSKSADGKIFIKEIRY